MESAFTFSFSPISKLSQYPSARSKSLSPCSVKTSQYRVRKCVHEGTPRATNRSRVNPITVQCKVGNCKLGKLNMSSKRTCICLTHSIYSTQSVKMVVYLRKRSHNRLSHLSSARLCSKVKKYLSPQLNKTACWSRPVFLKHLRVTHP